ncbi:PE family protein [Nocardia sp. CC227C]|uniref:PE family protein n=1 Tax=Nocardia sp. CC227C TaxID=3044562 RepID=UPI00278C7B38|nr:PE family protein [Nocardia sp. CC227C]
MAANEFHGVSFDPVAARDVAAQLDELADRLSAGLLGEQAKLNIMPAGADEVSVRASSTLNAVAATFQERGGLGVDELRKLAATLRAQSTRFSEAEERSVADLVV